MKKLFVLLLASCPFLGKCQKVEIGLVGGAVPFTSFKAIDQPVNSWELKKSLNWVIAVVSGYPLI